MPQDQPRRPGEPAAMVGRDDELRHFTSSPTGWASTARRCCCRVTPAWARRRCWTRPLGYARAQGYRVVRAAGAEFEAGVSFAALHQVLQPLFGEFGHLSQWHRDALTTALGLREGPRSDQLVLSNATLAVLAGATSQAPLLLVVDDLPWIDRASAAVLGFVARRSARSGPGCSPRPAPARKVSSTEPPCRPGSSRR